MILDRERALELVTEIVRESRDEELSDLQDEWEEFKEKVAGIAAFPNFAWFADQAADEAFKEISDEIMAEIEEEEIIDEGGIVKAARARAGGMLRAKFRACLVEYVDAALARRSREIEPRLRPEPPPE